jgi:hypothetical protein
LNRLAYFLVPQYWNAVLAFVVGLGAKVDLGKVVGVEERIRNAALALFSRLEVPTRIDAVVCG